MENVLIHEYTIKIAGVKKKTVYQFSDVHLNLSDELSSQSEKDETDKRVANWLGVRERFAKKFEEPFGEAQQLPAAEHFENLLAMAKTDGDALVIAGDLFDHINEAHLRMFEKRFSDLGIPYLYVCGNHEKLSDIPDDSFMAKIKAPIQILDLGDVLIVGFEDSQRNITKDQIEVLKELLLKDKPIILSMHIPIQAQGNQIHKNCSEYFRLNYDECPSENLEFINIICSNTDKIKAVFTGHLHFLNTFEIAPDLIQYVSTQGITGNINRYIIGE